MRMYLLYKDSIYELTCTSSEVVNEDKLCVFLRESVLDRAPKKGKNKEGTVSVSLVRGYVSAIVDLWVQQQAHNMNAWLNPRGAMVKSILSTLKSREHNKKRSEYQERGTRE